MKIIDWFITRNYKFRKIILITNDILILIFSFFTTYFLTRKVLVINFYELINYIYIASILSLILFILSGQYKPLTRHSSSKEIYSIIVRSFILIFFLSNINNFYNYQINNIFWILLFFLFSFLLSFSRIIIRDVIRNKKKGLNKIRVAIYGTGNLGVLLANALKIDGRFFLDAFITEETEYYGRELNSVPIKSINQICENSEKIDRVFIAINFLSKEKLNKIISKFKKVNLSVFQVPTIDDFTNGSVKLKNFRKISIGDLLGREPVRPKKSLLGPGIKDSVVCITGAGGSIGSELSKQVLKLKPSKLVLVDNNEYKLYKINLILNEDYLFNVEIKNVLLDITNKLGTEKIFEENKVDVLFHTAAYKHVPLVESYPSSSIYNNTLSTKNLCESCIKYSVKKFILISSDKAVRPTNIMGATKRLSEKIVKSYSNSLKNKINSKLREITQFSIVRFGNVLDSSGSVVPLFRRQIYQGGPITVTHPDIVRFFMTIEESCELVIQSSVLSEKGDVFVLDMGHQLRIIDLAKKMIQLSGLTEKDQNNLDGDIEIVFTGLRPGEKLYEELLINGKLQKQNIHLFSELMKMKKFVMIFL